MSLHAFQNMTLISVMLMTSNECLAESISFRSICVCVEHDERLTRTLFVRRQPLFAPACQPVDRRLIVFVNADKSRHGQK